MNECLGPAFEIMEAKAEACEDSKVKDALRATKSMVKKTVIKYLIRLMDLLADKKSPNAPEDTAEEKTPGNALLLAKIDKLATDFAILTTQLKLRDATSPPVMQAVIMQLAKDHLCSFKAMQSYADKIEDPNASLSLSKVSADIARASVLVQAQKEWKDNKDNFLILSEGEQLPDYQARLTENPSSVNWGGQMEAFLFCREHTTLEIRTIWRARNGKVTSHSTLREGETRNHVGFRMLDQASGHCNIGAIKKAGGPAQYIFSKQEADHE